MEELETELSTYLPDVTHAYLKSISANPLLTFDQEQELGMRAKQGDKKAIEMLVTCNLRLVVSIAKRYSHQCKIPFIDLIQEGNIGLMIAANKYDYSKGYRFSTYATWWIRQSILKVIKEQSRLIRIPVHVIEQLNKISKAFNDLTQELSREPSPKEIAAATGINEKKIKELQLLIKEPISIDQTINDEEEATMGELIADESADTPFQQIYNKDVTETIQSVLATLDKRETEILCRRYGIGKNRSQTLEEIGKDYGLSKERIRQIEEKALKKLRNPMRADLLRKCLET